MTKAQLFNQLSLMFDSDGDSLDAEEWTEQMEGAKHAIAKFERAAMARAVRFAARQAEERWDDGRPHINPNELMRIADAIESGEVEVPT